MSQTAPQNLDKSEQELKSTVFNFFYTGTSTKKYSLMYKSILDSQLDIAIIISSTRVKDLNIFFVFSTAKSIKRFMIQTMKFGSIQ
jgi:hypothetical protein